MPLIIGVVGDSGSGKSTVARAVAELLGPERAIQLKLDDYHRYTRAERRQRGVTALNPLVHNVPLMREHLQLLRSGRPIRNRSYEHADGTFGPIRTIEPRDVVLVRGLLGYTDEALCELYDLRVFLAPEPDLLFRWKLRRDVQTRGYTEAQVLKWIAQHLLDSKQFVLPQAERADVVVHYALPDPDAPDEQVETRVELRGRAAAALQDDGLCAWARRCCTVQPEPDRGGWLARPAGELDADAMRAWAADRCPGTGPDVRFGRYRDGEGELRFHPRLAAAEALIAATVRSLES